VAPINQNRTLPIAIARPIQAFSPQILGISPGVATSLGSEHNLIDTSDLDDLHKKQALTQLITEHCLGSDCDLMSRTEATDSEH